MAATRASAAAARTAGGIAGKDEEEWNEMTSMHGRPSPKPTRHSLPQPSDSPVYHNDESGRFHG